MTQTLPATIVSTLSSDDSLSRYRNLLRQLDQAINSHTRRYASDTRYGVASLEGLVCPSCDAVFDTHTKDCQLQLL